MTHRDRVGGLPRLSDGVAHASRCPASPQRTLRAENLGKPSLWVMISAPWYKAIAHERYVTFQLAEAAVPRDLFREILRLIDDLRPSSASV